jgi:hypothetical protein
MRLLIKFPTRGRRDLFFSTLSKFYSMASDIERIQFQITIDSDDEEIVGEQCGALCEVL